MAALIGRALRPGPVFRKIVSSQACDQDENCFYFGVLNSLAIY